MSDQPSHLTWEYAHKLSDNVTQSIRLKVLPFGWVDTEEEEREVRHLDEETRLNISELVQTADIVDSEFISLRQSMMDRGAPLLSWALLREGEEEGEPSQFLFTIGAYSLKEAWYLVFCHASSPKARLIGLPEDYPVDCVQMIEGLLGESGRVGDVMLNFISLATGAFRIVPAQGGLFRSKQRQPVTL